MAISVMLNLLVRELASCASTMGRVIACIFMRSGPLVIVLLAGGDKRTQQADIDRAIAISKEWKE